MGNIRLYGSTSGYTELAPPAVAPDGVLSLPSGTGTIATQDYAAAAGGLVHINTTTFSGVSSVSVDNVFTSDYHNYKILITYDPTSNDNVNMRLRASGTDSSGSDYLWSRNAYQYSAATQYAGATSATSWNINRTNTSTTPSYSSIDLFLPALSTRTAFAEIFANEIAQGTQGGRHTVIASYDGCTFLSDGGTIEGTLRIYGYSNGA